MTSQVKAVKMEQADPAAGLNQPKTTAVLPAPDGVTAPPMAGNLASPATYRYLHHSFDRKSQSSATQRMDARVGTSRGPVAAKGFRQSRSDATTPIVAQSTVSTTTTTTTTVTTTTTTNSGNQFTNFQPWYSTVTRTDVHQSSYTQRDSDMVLLAPPTAMDVTVPPMDGMQVDVHEPVINRRHGRRRSATERFAGEKLSRAACTCGPSHRASRRARGISAPTSMAPMDFTPEDIQVQLTKQENGSVAFPWTPAALVTLNSPPKASDLLIVRLLVDNSDDNEDSEHFLTAIAPKFSINEQGAISIPSQTLPPSVLSLGVTLDQCRLSFSLLTGERIQATHISDYLAGSSTENAPSSKRPRLH